MTAQCRFCFDWVSCIPLHEPQCKEELGAACSICSKWFSKKHIETHEQLCRSQGPQRNTLKCDVCGTRCVSDKGLERHQMYHCRAIKQVREVKCDRCGTWCVTDMGLTTHKRLHCHGMKQASLCGGSKEIEKQPISVVTANKCRFCLRLFMSEFLGKHELSCAKRPQKKCRFCGCLLAETVIHEHELTCKQNPNVHRKTKQLFNPEQSCEKSGENGDDTSNLANTNQNFRASVMVKTYQTHTLQQCKVCRNHFMSDEIKIHECSCKKLHMQCSLCLGWISRAYFYQHKLMCKQNQPVKQNTISCRFCKKTFSKMWIKRHEQLCEQFSKQKSVKQKCKVCKRTMSKSSLEMHEKSCMMQLKITLTNRGKCKFCHKNVSKSVLETHEQSCEIVMKYKRRKCRYCMEWFLCSGGVLSQHEVVCKHRQSGLNNFGSDWTPESEIKMHAQLFESQESCQQSPTGNIVVIKPEPQADPGETCMSGNVQRHIQENETDNIQKLYNAENFQTIFVIKPEKESYDHKESSMHGYQNGITYENRRDISRHCVSENASEASNSDGFFHGVKYETDDSDNLENNLDGNRLFMKSDPDVLYCDGIMNCSNDTANVHVIKPENFAN